MKIEILNNRKCLFIAGLTALFAAVFPSFAFAGVDNWIANLGSWVTGAAAILVGVFFFKGIYKSSKGEGSKKALIIEGIVMFILLGLCIFAVSMQHGNSTVEQIADTTVNAVGTATTEALN